MHTAVYKIDNQQEPTVYYRELYPIFCDNLMRKESKEWLYVYV